mmetsp:Transcript_10126/g.20514  ORF Transcript_10126/g.20514 Transcript_10126/m.20514 type:complete len:725 (-) Transcript_10126:30-2204(-)
MRRRQPQQQKRRPNPFAAHPGLPTTSVNLLTSNNPAPLNPFLASLELEASEPHHQTVDLSFKAGQGVGIHFRWVNGFYVVVGFTDDSPAKAQGKVENGCTLLAVNGLALSGVQQKVVNNTMKELADKDRVLSFTTPAPPARRPPPPAASQKPPTMAIPLVAAATTKPARAPPPTQPRRKSSDNDITTPARRMRIIYEFTKVFVLKKVLPEGLLAGIALMRKIEAAEVIQSAIRAFLARKIFTAAMKLKKFTAAVKIQTRIRMMLSKLELWRLRRAKEVRRRNRAATKGQSAIRMALAKLRCRRIREDMARSEEETRLTAATKIQAGARKRASLKAYRQAMLSTKLLQGRVRGMLARALFELMLKRNTSAVKLQAWARGLMGSKRARKRLEAVVFLQRAVRSWLLILAAKRLLEELRRKMREENEAAAAVPSPVVVAGTPDKGDGNGPGGVGDDGKLDSVGTAKSEFTPGVGQVSPLGDGGYEAEGEGDSSPEKSPVWQLRYSPNKEGQAHNNEVYMTEDVGEAGLYKEDSPVKSPQVDQETKFRLEREAREAEAREDLATRLQARARGARSRKQISAMKRVAAAVSQVNHVAKCRLMVLQLIRERNRCAELLQKMVRRRLAKLKVGRARLERLELVVEAVEREYGITELAKREGGSFFGNAHLYDDLGPSQGVWKEPRLTREQAKWLRIFPEHARPCYGSDFFRDLEGESLEVDVIEGLGFRIN